MFRPAALLTILAAVALTTGSLAAPGLGGAAPPATDGHEHDHGVAALPLARTSTSSTGLPAVASGFFLSPLASLAVPTAITFGPGDGDGPDLYATLLTGTVERVELTWTPAGPLATGTATVATGFGSPLGLVFDDDGNLYVADSHANQATFRVDGRVTMLAPGEATQADGTVVVDGLPQGQHNVNNLRFGPDGRLYMPNGNPNDHGNGTGSGQSDVFPYSGAILSVDADEVAASPAILHWTDADGARIAADELVGHPINADFADKVDVYAHGFRNIYDVAFAPPGLPFAGTAYTGMNGADDPDSQDALFKVVRGANHRFPFCYNVGPTAGTGDEVAVVQAPDSPDPSVGCEDAPPATALLGWHTCATGLDFPTSGDWAFPDTHRSSVYVGECGPFQPDDVLIRSLEDDPTTATHNTGHKVRRVVLDEGGDATAVEDFVTGLALPTDVHFGPDGAMYIADAGAIYRVAPVVPGPAGSATVTVAAVGTQFVPPVVVVPQGTTVRWEGTVRAHTVTTSDELCKGPLGDCTPNDATNGQDGDPDTFNRGLPAGSAVEHTFDEPGTYEYYCGVHASLAMTGVVVVI